MLFIRESNQEAIKIFHVFCFSVDTHLLFILFYISRLIQIREVHDSWCSLDIGSVNTELWNTEIIIDPKSTALGINNAVALANQ